MIKTFHLTETIVGPWLLWFCQQQAILYETEEKSD